MLLLPLRSACTCTAIRRNRVQSLTSPTLDTTQQQSTAGVTGAASASASGSSADSGGGASVGGSTAAPPYSSECTDIKGVTVRRLLTALRVSTDCPEVEQFIGLF